MSAPAPPPPPPSPPGPPGPPPGLPPKGPPSGPPSSFTPPPPLPPLPPPPPSKPGRPWRSWLGGTLLILGAIGLLAYYFTGPTPTIAEKRANLEANANYVADAPARDEGERKKRGDALRTAIEAYESEVQHGRQFIWASYACFVTGVLVIVVGAPLERRRGAAPAA